MFQASVPTKHLHLKSSFERMPCFTLLFIMKKYFTIMVIYIIVCGFTWMPVNIAALWHCLFKKKLLNHSKSRLSVIELTAPGTRVGFTESVHLRSPWCLGQGMCADSSLLWVSLWYYYPFNIFHLPKVHTTYFFVFISSSLTIISKHYQGKFSFSRNLIFCLSSCWP